jgi:hypothetical protein
MIFAAGYAERTPFRRGDCKNLVVSDCPKADNLPSNDKNYRKNGVCTYCFWMISTKQGKGNSLKFPKGTYRIREKVTQKGKNELQLGNFYFRLYRPLCSAIW